MWWCHSACRSWWRSQMDLWRDVRPVTPLSAPLAPPPLVCSDWKQDGFFPHWSISENKKTRSCMINGTCSALWLSVVSQPDYVDEITAWMALCCCWTRSPGLDGLLDYWSVKHQSVSCAQIHDRYLVQVLQRALSQRRTKGRRVKVFIFVHLELLAVFVKMALKFKKRTGFYLVSNVSPSLLAS